jgi:diketogulonate reductase-like aldo/keto reductase
VDFTNKDLVSIAAKHSVTPAQVALRWVTQQKIQVATSPGSNEQYAKDDLGLFKFTLSDAQMAVLSAI